MSLAIPKSASSSQTSTGLSIYTASTGRTEDGELHSHPFEWSVALILAGGYREERRDDALSSPSVRTKNVKPWTLNFIRHDTFHRVDLLEDDAWSLFLVGPKTKSWGFWDRVTGQYTEWREFLRRRQTPTIDERSDEA
jgi:hypothetical protein